MIRSGEQALFEAALATGGVPKRPPRRRPRPGREPRVRTEEVRLYVREAYRPQHEGRAAMHPSVIAARAGLSTQTVYRVINQRPPYDGETMPLKIADALMVALDRSLDDLELVER